MSLQRFKNYDLDGMPPVRRWNPLAMRCTRVDEGCRNCWHLRMADRLGLNPVINAFNRMSYLGAKVYLSAKIDGKLCATRMFNTIDSLASLKTPRVICVQFMGDLWHPSCDHLRPWVVNDILSHDRNAKHIFLLLTKRPENVTEELPDNCWLGTSVHDQASAEVRVPQLLAAKARHKWLSVEPMLGAVSLGRTGALGCDCEDGERCSGQCAFYKNAFDKTERIGFVACGPETGRGARPCDQEWITGLSRQCKEVGIPFYDKRGRFVCGNCRKTFDAHPSENEGRIECPRCKTGIDVHKADDFTRREWPKAWTEKIGGCAK